MHKEVAERSGGLIVNAGDLVLVMGVHPSPVIANTAFLRPERDGVVSERHVGQRGDDDPLETPEPQRGPVGWEVLNSASDLGSSTSKFETRTPVSPLNESGRMGNAPNPTGTSIDHPNLEWVKRPETAGPSLARRRSRGLHSRRPRSEQARRRFDASTSSRRPGLDVVDEHERFDARRDAAVRDRPPTIPSAHARSEPYPSTAVNRRANIADRSHRRGDHTGSVRPDGGD